MPQSEINKILKIAKQNAINAGVKSSNNNSNNLDLSNMKLYEYGKGYLLVPPTNHTDFGKPYLYGKIGWWNKKQKGWFFKNDSEDWLLEHGAFPSDVNSNSNTNQTIDLSNMKLKKYGKGYLLVPPTNHTDFGEKYYHDRGWWIPNQNGWFFKNQHKDWLNQHGAK